MKAALVARGGAWLAAAWVGVMAGVGAVAAPVLFSVLPRPEAGLAAARLFSVEAMVGIALGALLALIGLQLGRDCAERGQGSRFGAELLLALAALFCIVAGHYALLPMIEAARAGQGTLSFGALHAIATALFVARIGVVGVLAWRLSAPLRLSPAVAS